jgi:tetratricopeptide (TPR) repeat protein
MRIAAALIVKGTDAEALLLNRCLDSIAPYVDGIFVTRTTTAGEKPNGAVANVVTSYNGYLSDFTWIDDFSAARNFNFQQVPTTFDYIIWSDADDIWRGLEKLRPTLEKYPHVDGFGFWYLYEWDEFRLPTVAHRKTMLIKNNGCATWKGAVHEDLQPNRDLSIHLVEGIERLHITDSKRMEESAERNLQISKKEKDDDPRTAWNLANAQFAVSDFEGARNSFKEFINTSHSNEEIYLARTRLANVYKSLGRREGCIKELQSAIGLMPSQPDAYLQLAGYYYEFDNLGKAEEYGLMGIIKRPQIHKLIAFNPRDYDYNPMMLMAKIYTRLNRPHDALTFMEGCLRIYPKDKKLKEYVKEGKKDKRLMARVLKKYEELKKIKDKKKLKKELDGLPLEIRSHPGICVLRNENFIKETSSGRDLVIYCGNTIETWNPETFKTKMVGGSEEAVIHMAREYGKLGWQVTVYNNCGHKETGEFVIANGKGIQGANAIRYKPFWEFNYRDKQDVVIIWRWPKVLDADINAPRIFLDMHDVVSEGEFTPERLKKVTRVMVKSQFHRSLFPNVPDEKFAIIPNGVEINIDPTITRDPYLIINTSSPDRSMDVMPKLFREIKKQVPQAKMQWAYGWKGFVNAHGSDAKKMDWMERTKHEMEEAGIESLGALTQDEVGKLYQKASILAYPTEFAEIDCISVKKAQASYCFVVATDFGALDESIDFGRKVQSFKTKDNWNRPYQFHFGLEDEAAQKKFVECCVISIQDQMADWYKPLREKDNKLKDKWAKQFTWHNIAERWRMYF